MRQGTTYRPQSPEFGNWLLSEIRAAGMNQGEFAERVGVSRTTVSRWIHGRVPDGVFIDGIADVLTLDYDHVAARAGHRPRGLDAHDPDSPPERLCAKLRRVDWSDPQREQLLDAMLTQMLAFDRAQTKGR